MKNYVRGLLCVALVLYVFSASAQVNTLYYMENVPARNVLNPAFIPTQKFYIDLPVISGIAFSVGNNSVAGKDLFLKQGTKLITPFHPDADHDPFFNVLKPSTNLNTELRQNLLGFGFSLHSGFVSFGLTERVQSEFNLPKSLAALLFNGAPDTVGVNHYDLKKLGMNMTAYLEMAFGYTMRLDSQWNVGAKLKVLFGQAHAKASFSSLSLDISKQQVDLYGSGDAKLTLPVDVPQRSDGLADFGNIDGDVSSILKPVGLGAAVDLGAEYKFNKQLTFSAAVNDLGFIRWKKTSWGATLKKKTTFDGLDFSINGNNDDWGKQIGDSLRNAFDYTSNGAGYTSLLSATARFGVDYAILKRKIDFGLLWTNTFLGDYHYNELLASVNFRPCYWVNASFSYGCINGNMGTLGFGLNLIGGPLNFFVATDYFPTYYTADGIPYKSKYVNGHVGLSLTFGRKKAKKIQADCCTNNVDIEEKKEQ